MTDHGQSQKRAWEAEMFRLLAENVKDYAIFVVDPHRHILSWSKGAERLLGFTEEEILGKQCDSFFTPEDVERGVPQKELEQALATGRGEDDRWHMRKDGSRFWASGAVTPLKDEAGQLRGFAKLMRDRTDLKKSQEALHDALAYADAIIATVREPLLVLDGDLRVRTANRSFYRTFCVKAEDTEGRLLYDLGNRQWDIPRLKELLESILPQDAVFNDFEVEHGFPDIGPRVMLLNARKLSREGSHAELILLAAEDVTERRQAERQVREQRELLQATLSSVGDAVIATDARGHVNFLNPVAQRLTGWSPEQAAGRPLGDVFRIVNEFSRQPVENPVTRALREGAVVGLANHTVLVAADGTERPIDDSAAPIKDDAGQVCGAVLVFRDISERRRAEQLAEDARRYAESIVETVREPLVVLDAALRVKTANRSFYKTFRVAPEETEGRLLYDLGEGHWEVPALRRLLGEILPQNTSFNDFEVEHDFPAIGSKVMLLNARKMYREGNHAELILLAIEDVTALREAERVRREAEARFTEMVKNVRDHSIFLTDPEGVITSWNVAAERIIGYAETEAVGRHFSLIFTPQDVRDGVPEQELRQAREEGRAEDERWHRKKDGTSFWALGIVTPLHNPDGRLAGFSKILRDMTAWKKADEELAASRRRLQAVFDTSLDAILLADDQSRFVDANPAACTLLGQGREELLLCGVFDITTPSNAEAGRAAWAAFVRVGQQSGEYALRRKDGTTVVVEYRAVANVLPGLHLSVLRDVSERKRAEEALKEADRRKDEFLAMLAHELRNPLAPIRNAAQVIRLVGSADSTVQRSTEMIERQVQHMTRLVDDLLDVSRITSGKIQLQKEPVELAAVVTRAVETARPLIEARRHELTVTLPPEPVSLDADLTRLAQVIANLLTNAAKYTEEGGHIGLTARREGGMAVVRVRDDGVGIPREMLASVFTLFTQVDRSLARSEGGLGIGLTLVKSLTEMHGGTVEAHSGGPGKGSEFVVRLPVLPRPQSSGAGMEGTDAPGPSPPRRVLVVDDNEDAADSLAMLLRLGGHDVRTAHDGATALQAAEAFRPEVVLLDIGLPRMDGYEVARRLRGQPGTKGVLLVALTGYGQDEDRRKSQEAGFDGHLVKPVDTAQLQALFGSPAQG